ncbi:MAG: DUF1559 domain-containing protein, partial [Pirellula sp.]
MILNQSEVAVDENVRAFFRYWQKSTTWQQAVAVSDSRSLTLDVLANDTLQNRAATKIVSVTQPVFGSVTIVSGNGGIPDRIQYNSSPFFVGADQFQYQIYDSISRKVASAVVRVEFVGGNLNANATLQQRMQTNPQIGLLTVSETASFLMASGQKLIGNRVTNAKTVADNSENVFGILHEAPKFGSLQFNPDGTFQYKPNSGFVGTDSFTLFESNLSFRRLRRVSIQVASDVGALDALRLLEIGKANLNYESDNRRLFYPTTTGRPTEFDANSRPLVGWRVRMLPYLGFNSLYQRFRLNEAWDSPNNLPLLSEMPDIFRSAGDPIKSTTTRYQVLANAQNTNLVPLFLNEQDHRLSSTSLSDVTDGLLHTIAMVQSGVDKGVPWTKPDDLDFNAADPLSSVGNVGAFVNALFINESRSPIVRQIPLSVGNAAFLSMASLVEANGITLDVPTNARNWSTIPGVRPMDGLYEDSGMQAAMRRVGLGLANYEAAFKRFAPAPSVPTDANGMPYLSWRVYILPYLGYSSLYAKFKLDEPWDSANNLPLLNLMPDFFRSVGDSFDSSVTRIHVLGGPGMAYQNYNTAKSGPRFVDFTDRDSVLFVEAGVEKQVPWTKPGVLEIDPANVMASLGSFPSGEILVSTKTAVIRKLPTTIPLDAFVSLLTVSPDSVRNPRSPYEVLGVEPLLGPRGYLVSRDTQSMRELALSLLNFESAVKRFPRNYRSASNQQLLSWRVAILPYIGETDLFNSFRLDEPWDSAHNLALLPGMPRIFRGANDPSVSSSTRFQMFDGTGSINPSGPGVRSSDITDGTWQTAVLVRSGWDKAVPWTKPDDVDLVGPDSWESVGDIGSKTLFATANSSITRFGPSVGKSYLSAIVTINGGEVLSDVRDTKTVLYVREGGGLDFVDSSATNITADQSALVSFSAVGGRVTVGTPDNVLIDGTRRTKIRLNGVPLDVIAFSDDSREILPIYSSPVRVTELGDTADHWVRLNAPITSDITIEATADDATEIALSNATLTFTAANWNVPQRITVQGVPDGIADGDVASLIQWRVTSSGNSAFPVGLRATSQAITLDNRPPRNVRLQNVLDVLRESADTTNAIEIAKVLFDDDFGNNLLSLTGPDASSFVLVGDRLYLKAGTILDFKTKPQLRVRIAVDDPSIGDSPDAYLDFVLNIIEAINQPAGIMLANATSALPSQTVAAGGMRVADVVVLDDSIGANALSLSGPDAASFFLVGDKLFVKGGTVLDFQAKPEFRVRVSVDDPSVGDSPDAFVDFVLNVIDSANLAPGLMLANATSSLPERTDVSGGWRVADIVIPDDCFGSNALSLTGPDAGAFEIVSKALRIRTSQLDFETKSTYRVTIAVDDPAVGSSPDASIDFILAISDVNEAPGLSVTNVVTSVSESNSSGLDVADVAILDDALGTNNIIRSGPDAAMFEVVAGKLKLKPGQLDFETKPVLRVTVSVDDPAVGTTPDQSVDIALTVIDVNEAPGLSLSNVVTSVPESNTTGLDVADVAIVDDALGTNAISLSGLDAARFEMVSGKLKLKPGSLDFETKPVLRVTVSVDDPTVGATPDQSINLVLNVTDVNEAPGLTVTNVVTSISESNNAGPTIADVAIVDDALGINTISLSGPDAASFEVGSGKLKVKAGQLDFETKPVLRVTVSVDDPTVGATPDQSIELVLNVTDANDAPGLTVSNQVASIAESNTSGMDVADVAVRDDALGTNAISLSGPDAASFEVVSGKLKLKPSQLDFETKPVLRVTVSVDDSTVGSSPDQSIDVALNVTDVNEAPGLTLTNDVT